MTNDSIFVSELSAARHSFSRYHFCRGNSNKRKSRLGVILKGSGSYLYLGKRLQVSEGDIVFIPERIFCYSEWHGSPEIEVVYLSCFIHYKAFLYEPQVLGSDAAVREAILQIADLLSADRAEPFEAYSRFYRLLGTLLPGMTPSTLALDKHLSAAIEYMTEHFAERFSVADLARHVCISESGLYHLFKRELGTSPVHYLNSIRINIAIEHLENGHHSISTVSTMVGFASENHFRRIFREHTGTTPHKYRKGK